VAMRKISFRAWDIVDKKMYNNAIDNCKDSFDMILKHPQIYKVMQFTGFRDDNCVEACEGDLIPYVFNNEKLGVVKYGNYKNICDDEFTDHIGFYIEWQNEELKSMVRIDLGYWLKVSSIVGNIYENPELLKNKEV